MPRFDTPFEIGSRTRFAYESEGRSRIELGRPLGDEPNLVGGKFTDQDAGYSIGEFLRWNEFSARVTSSFYGTTPDWPKGNSTHIALWNGSKWLFKPAWPGVNRPSGILDIAVALTTVTVGGANSRVADVTVPGADLLPFNKGDGEGGLFTIWALDAENDQEEVLFDFEFDAAVLFDYAFGDYSGKALRMSGITLLEAFLEADAADLEIASLYWELAFGERDDVVPFRKFWCRRIRGRDQLTVQLEQAAQSDDFLLSETWQTRFSPDLVPGRTVRQSGDETEWLIVFTDQATRKGLLEFEVQRTVPRPS